MVLIPVRCLYCQSDQVTKRGKTKAGKQRYRCHNPGPQFLAVCRRSEMVAMGTRRP
jgi:transposase-like protein